MKRIEYSEHLKIRMKLRNIPLNLPKDIYLKADAKFFDTATQHKIALKSLEYMGKVRDIIICYDESESEVKIITIHPLKTYQKVQRIKSGRWQRL